MEFTSQALPSFSTQVVPMEPTIEHDSCITLQDNDGWVDHYLLPNGGKLEDENQRQEIWESCGCHVGTRPVRKSRRNQGYHVTQMFYQACLTSNCFGK